MSLLKIKSSEITWYEEDNFVEWWENDNISHESRKFDYFTLKEAIDIAKFNKITLCIQPAYQNQTIFVDYSE